MSDIYEDVTPSVETPVATEEVPAETNIDDEPTKATPIEDEAQGE